MKLPYIQFSLYDLYQRFAEMLSLNAAVNRHKYSVFANNEADPSKANELRDKAGQLATVHGSNDILKDLETFGFHELCCRGIREDLLPQSDADKLRRFADLLSSVADEVRKEGRVTDRASNLIDAHDTDARSRLYKEIFGEDPIH